VPTPKIRIDIYVKTDGFVNRIVCLTGEACLFVLEKSRTKQKQVERRGFVMDKQVADDSVVVIKSEPEKSGNSMEDKTQMILHKLQACKSCDSRYLFKRYYRMRRDEVKFKKCE